MSTIENLCQLIEHTTGTAIKTPKDFDSLSDKIYARIHQRISPTTLKRIWGYQNDEGPRRISTMDLLAQFCGYKDWNSFSKNNGKELDQSNLILNRCIHTENLEKGDLIQIVWAPDRCCEIKYLGNFQFKIEKVQHSKLLPGATFKCNVFIENEPLYLYSLIQDNQPETCYVAGKHSGIRFEKSEKK